ncbi:unnamed protein product [Closterium sp. NIES-54]
MPPLRSSGESCDGRVASSGGGGTRSSSRCGAVRLGVSGGGQIQLHRRQHEPLSTQQLREWYARKGSGSGSSGGRYAAVRLGVSGGGMTQLQRSQRETLTPQQLHEWYVQRGTSRSSARCSYVIRTGAARGTAFEGAELGGAGPGGAEPGGAKTGVAEPGGVEPGGAASEVLLVLRRDCLRSSCVSGLFGVHAFGVELPELEVLELEELVLLTLVALCSRDRTSFPCFSRFLPASLLPAPSPYTEQFGGLTERREPTSRPVSPVRTARRVPRSRPPPIPSTHAMTLCPSSVPLLVPLPAPPESSLPEVAHPESDHTRAASPTVSRLLATTVNDPSFESAAASALSVSAGPGECALGTDILEDRQEDFECLAAAVPRFASMLLAPEGDPDALDIPTPRSYAEAITGPYSSQWQAAMDAEMASWKSTGTYIDEIPPRGANILDGMWIFRVKRLFSQRQGRDYELHSLDFSTAFLQSSLHEEIWLRRPPGFTAGTQWSFRRPVYGLRQAPREWHETLRTTLVALGFAPSTADPSLFLRTDTSLPPFYVLVYVNDLVFATADTEALTLVKLELQKRHTCTDLGPLALRLPVLLATAHSSVYQPLALSSTFGRVRRAEWHQKVHWDATKRVLRYMCSTSGMGLVLGGRGPVVLTGHADASWVEDAATQRSSQGNTFSLGSGFVSWRSTHSSSVLSSSCEAEIYAGAMAEQELRWLTYLLTNLGEEPRSPSVLYVDKKAMIALCQEHRLEHITKHIALQYFLARELQQRGQLHLAYVATRANTADIFTKALPPGDH